MTRYRCSVVEDSQVMRQLLVFALQRVRELDVTEADDGSRRRRASWRQPFRPHHHRHQHAHHGWSQAGEADRVDETHTMRFQSSWSRLKGSQRGPRARSGAGANAYITKPIEGPQVVAKVERAASDVTSPFPLGASLKGSSPHLGREPTARVSQAREAAARGLLREGLGRARSRLAARGRLARCRGGLASPCARVQGYGRPRGHAQRQGHEAGGGGTRRRGTRGGGLFRALRAHALGAVSFYLGDPGDEHRAHRRRRDLRAPRHLRSPSAMALAVRHPVVDSARHLAGVTHVAGSARGSATSQRLKLL